MPSAINCSRSAEEDLVAISLYARTYRGKEWNARVQSASRAYKELKKHFLKYQELFETPRRLFPAKLRSLASFLYDLYDSDAKPFRYIAELRDYEKFGACPYCGLPKNITVDHYLPRKLRAFPHLSTLSLNLVPACSDCQGSKLSFYSEKPPHATPAKACRNMQSLQYHRNKTSRITKARRSKAPPAVSPRLPGPTPRHPGKANRIRQSRRFIHPYLDRFLSRCAFDLALTWSGEYPEIESFLWKPYLTSAQRALVAFHVRKMKVKERASGIIRRRYSAFARTVTGQNLTQDIIINRLQFKLDIVQQESGLANSIEARYFDALLRDHRAISHLVAKSADPKQEQLVLESTASSNAMKNRQRRQRRGYIY